MYNTKRFHQTAAHDYLAVGDNYVDKYELISDRYKSRQFQTSCTKSGQLNGYFSAYKHTADQYIDNTGYIESQPLSERKNGFGTSDAIKRDEFTLNIKSLQYKELLSHEQKYQKKHNELNNINNNENNNIDNTVNELHDKKSKLYQYNVPHSLYDIGRTHSTPICNKCKTDTFYCIHRINNAHKQSDNNNTSNDSLRHTGTYKTSTSDIGSLITSNHIQQQLSNIVKSAGNHQSIASFYDNTHLNASQRL